MLTDWRRSWLLLIRIRTERRRRVVIPVSLVALEQLFRAWLELARFLGDLVPVKLFTGRQGGWGKAGKRIPLNQLFLLCQELWNEIRSYDRWQVAEIENDRIRLEIWLV
jgi:hypothetical protein